MGAHPHRSVWARLGVGLVHCILMAGGLIMVLPMLWMLATAFKPPTEISIWPPQWLPQAPTWENFVGIFKTVPFGRFFLNSLGTSLVSTLTSLKYPRRSTRSRDSLMRRPSYHDDSNWRNSRRTTSSRVRVLPATLMRRT